jgi:putative nucleotidyltransferase with HDIG domain
MARFQSRRLLFVALFMFSAALAGAAVSSRSADWQPLWLVIGLAVLASAGDLVNARMQTMTLSAGLTIVAVAMALLGPAPALAIMWTAVTITEIVASGPTMRGRRVNHLWNLATFASVLVGALIIRAAVDLGVSREGAEYGAFVFGALGLTNVVNFTLIAIFFRVTKGVPIATQYRQMFLPALPWLLTPNLLVVGLVMLYIHLGAVSLVLVLALLAGFYVLMIELVRSRERGEQLAERGRELAQLQLGVLVTMVRTLSLRDKSTARHSAAVARYARAIAKATGCSKEEQDLVHTAGLLHDIGKFAFPDRILLASNGLTDDDREVVKQHPVDGERLVSQIDGYERIGKVIRHHHERIDGRGYPDGLTGDEIPALSRMISVADIYDVITGRDTYRKPISRAGAIAELRRSAGTQLDASYVEAFINVLERESLSFTHTEESDFEAELALEDRVRDLASPRRPSAEPARKATRTPKIPASGTLEPAA